MTYLPWDLCFAVQGSWLFTPDLARQSALSLPGIAQWTGIHCTTTVHCLGRSCRSFSSWWISWSKVLEIRDWRAVKMSCPWFDLCYVCYYKSNRTCKHHHAVHSTRQEETRQTKEMLTRYHQGMDGTASRQDPVTSRGQRWQGSSKHLWCPYSPPPPIPHPNG